MLFQDADDRPSQLTRRKVLTPLGVGAGTSLMAVLNIAPLALLAIVLGWLGYETLTTPAAELAGAATKAATMSTSELPPDGTLDGCHPVGLA